jgi:hypothetical protein
MNFVFGPHSYGEHPSDFGAWGMTGTITTGKFCSVGGGLKFMLNGNHRTEGFTSYPVHLLGCRFIKAFEKGYESHTLVDIVKEFMIYADLVTLSFKKMYSHSGGAILVNKQSKILNDE